MTSEPITKIDLYELKTELLGQLAVLEIRHKHRYQIMQLMWLVNAALLAGILTAILTRVI